MTVGLAVGFAVRVGCAGVVATAVQPRSDRSQAASSTHKTSSEMSVQ